MTSDSPIEVAKRRVVDARARVLVQEKLVAEAIRDGRDVPGLHDTLEALRRALEVFEKEYEAAIFNARQQ